MLIGMSKSNVNKYALRYSNLISLYIYIHVFVFSASIRTWRIMSYLVAVPACVILGINTYLVETEHKAHWKQPEFLPYEHLNLRTKVKINFIKKPNGNHITVL